MSLLDATDAIIIKLYYTLRDVGGATRLIILEDEKAEKMLDNEENEEKVEVLETKWKFLLWKEQNEVMNLSYGQVNPMTGMKEFSLVIYRDAIIRRCLTGWNLKDDDKNIPVNDTNIDKLPANVMISLYTKYDTIVNYSEEDMGK